MDPVEADVVEWPPPHGGTRRGPARLSLVAGVVVGLLLGGVGGAYLAIRHERGAAGHTILGTITIMGGDGILGGYQSGQLCSGAYGYNDLHSNAAVIVVNGSETKIAAATLNAGLFERGETPAKNSCTFTFTVPKVPNSAAYEVQIGTGRRGGPRFTRAELEQDHWRVDLTLGASDGSSNP